ncbi:MAG: amino acid permease [Gammaproteobacteria bacterium]|nr:amino acid permease [Gammaproteobacteria bacterium]
MNSADKGGEKRLASEQNPVQKVTGLNRLLLRKSVEQVHAEHAGSTLKRELGAINLISLGIGGIIGTGIFVLTGSAAANFAGPAITVSFIITGLLCAFVALCYAELASMLPVSGSAYSYTYTSLGEFAAWLMGLLLVLEYGLAASTVAAGWSGYFVSLLANMGITWPPELAAAPGVAVKLADGTMTTGLVNLPALLAIGVVTWLLVLGVSESAKVNNIIVVIKLTVVIAFIALGAFFVDSANWTPLVPDEVPPPPEGTERGFWPDIWRAFTDVLSGEGDSRYGIGGIISGAAVIFFAYIGFEAVSTAGAESRNPSRDMPIGILGSLIICTILYILTAGVLVGIVPYMQLNDPAPIALAVNQMGMPWFAILVKIGAIAGLSSVMLVLLYAQTRVFYTMSGDGLIPGTFSKIHDRFRTPAAGTIVVGVIASIFAGFMSLDNLASLTNVGSLAAFAMVCLTVIYLRIAAPELKRPFRTPLYPLVPLLGAAMCLFLVMSLMAQDVTREFFLIYLAMGVVVYFLYGIRKGKLARA